MLWQMEHLLLKRCFISCNIYNNLNENLLVEWSKLFVKVINCLQNSLLARQTITLTRLICWLDKLQVPLICHQFNYCTCWYFLWESERSDLVECFKREIAPLVDLSSFQQAMRKRALSLLNISYVIVCGGGRESYQYYKSEYNISVFCTVANGL